MLCIYQEVSKIVEVLESTVYLVPSHQQKDIEQVNGHDLIFTWKYSFVNAERILLTSLNENVQFVLFFLLYIGRVACCEQERACGPHFQATFARLCKASFFWCLEMNVIDFVVLSAKCKTQNAFVWFYSIFEAITEVLLFMLQCIRVGNLPDYFVEDFNLLKVHEAC